MLFIKTPMFCCLGLALQTCLSTITVAFVIKLSNHNGSPTSCLAPKKRLAKGLWKAVMDEPEDSQFGRQDYWNQLYEKQSNFSWYAGWEDLQPFVDEFVDKSNDRVLIPGVGNDATLVDMYDDGYLYLTAMDYAPEGIERCREMLGSSRIREHDGSESGGVELVVADARDLKGVFDDHSFDAVMEKGTLDAIFLSGGHDKIKSEENLNLAISELGRCVNPGGIWISIAAVVDDQIQASLDDRKEWESLVRKGDLFITEDGYTSNNVDGTLLVWRKTS